MTENQKAVKTQKENTAEISKKLDNSNNAENLEQSDIIMLRIKVNEVSHEGKKFFVYKAVKKNGDLVNAKFTKAALKDFEIEKDCAIKVDLNNMNLDSITNIRPTLWIKKIEEILSLETLRGNRDLSALREQF